VKAWTAMLFVLAMCLCATAANAASTVPPVVVSQVNWLNTVLKGGTNWGGAPAGQNIAVNSSAGEVFVGTNQDLEMLNTQTGVVTSVLGANGGGWGSVQGVTIDAQNNLYVTNAYSSSVVKVPYLGNGNYAVLDTGTKTACANFGANSSLDTASCYMPNLTFSGDGWYFQIENLVLDAQGDLFWETMPSYGEGKIWECSLACLAGTGGATPIVVFQEPVSATAQLQIGEMAFDPSGNLFFTDESGNGTTSNLNELLTSSAAGYGGAITGFAAAPTVLYSYTPSSPGDQIDGVAIDQVTGTVYMATLYSGTYAFPNNAGTVNPAQIYGVSAQGAKVLGLDASGNLYVVSNNTVISSGGADTYGQITVNNVTFPTTPLGVTATNSATLNPITIILNDGTCAGGDNVSVISVPSVFVPTMGTTCTSTDSGGASYPLSIAFTPTAAGPVSGTLMVTDSLSNSVTGTISGAGQALTAQTINFTMVPPVTAVYGAGPFQVTATGGGSGNPVVFTIDASSTAGAGSISGSTLTITGVGTIVIDANQAGNSSYSAAPQVQATVTVSQAPQTINFTAPPSSVSLGAAPITLSATAGSGLPVTFTIDAASTGTGTISGNTLTFTGAGTLVIDANQAGNADYAPASQVQQTITVKAAPAIPAAADVILSQVNWLIAFPNGGALSSADAAGTSFAVNTDGNILVSTEYGGSVLLVNPKTLAVTNLGSYGNVGPVTIDSQNNLYIGGLYTNAVVKVPYNGGAYATVSSPSTDNSGNLTTPAPCTGTDTTECGFAWNSAANNNYLNSAANGYYFGVSSMAFDAAGDFFYSMTNANTAPDSIWECNVACIAGNGAPVEVYQEVQSPTTIQLNVGAMAFDQWGNLFFTDSDLNGKGSNESVYSDLNELPVSAGAGFGGVTTGFAATPTVLSTQTNATPGNYDDELDAVTVGTDGTVYFATQYDGIFAFPNTGAAINLAAMYTVSTQGAKLLTIDSKGNLFGAVYSSATGSGGDTLFESTVNNVALPTTQVGNSSTNSATLNPVNIILNDGDCTTPETVTFSSPADFSAVLIPPVAPATTTCASTFSGGSAFPVAITFTPTSGASFSETLTTTDSDGNSGAATLAGIGQSLIAQTITFNPVPPASVVYGVAPITLTATGGASTNPVVLSIDASSTAGAGTLSGNTLTITGVGTIVIDANQAGDSTYAAAPQVQVTITVTAAPQVIAFTNPTASESVVFGVAPITLAATGGASTSPVVFTIDASSTAGAGSLSGSTLTITGPGTIVIDANQAATTDYSAAAQVQVTITVTKATQAITFTSPAASESVTYGVAPIALAATGGASSNAVVFTIDPSSTAGAGTLSGSTLTVTGLGTIVIDANQAGNSDYTAAPQAQLTITVNPIGQVVAPAFTPAAGTYYGSATKVTLASTTAGATIYYTVTAGTTGTTPTTSSTKYTGAIPLATIGTSTIEAIAVETGYTSSTVATATYTISAIPPDFSFTLTPPEVSIVAGSTGAVTVSITPEYGFDTAVTFACTGLPSGATCASTSVTPNGTAVATAQLSISTTSASVAAVHTNSSPLFPGATLAVALCCFFGFKNRRRLQLLLLLTVSVVGMSLFTGCGGKWSPTFSRSTVTVTATSGSLQKTAEFTLIVNK
jgi:hypothetical protein